MSLTCKMGQVIVSETVIMINDKQKVPDPGLAQYILVLCSLVLDESSPEPCTQLAQQDFALLRPQASPSPRALLFQQVRSSQAPKSHGQLLEHAPRTQDSRIPCPHCLEPIARTLLHQVSPVEDKA